MSKFHITEDGPKKCTASVRECKYGSTDGGGHYNDVKEAQAVYEKTLESKNGVFAKKSKRKALEPPVDPIVGPAPSIDAYKKAEARAYSISTLANNLQLGSQAKSHEEIQGLINEALNNAPDLKSLNYDSSKDLATEVDRVRKLVNEKFQSSWREVTKHNEVITEYNRKLAAAYPGDDTLKFITLTPRGSGLKPYEILNARVRGGRRTYLSDGKIYHNYYARAVKNNRELKERKVLITGVEDYSDDERKTMAALLANAATNGSADWKVEVKPDFHNAMKDILSSNSNPETRGIAIAVGADYTKYGVSFSGTSKKDKMFQRSAASLSEYDRPGKGDRIKAYKKFLNELETGKYDN